jgi:hypothetical protein
MMHKIISSIILGLFLMVLMPKAAFAHVLKADGNIGAVIHINPEDNPIVNQPSTFFFEFKDKTGKFNPATCDCALTIVNRDTEVLSEPLFAKGGGTDLFSPAFSYTFPEKSLYTIVVTGKPKPGSDFQTFRLTYDLRVDRGEEGSAHANPEKPNHNLHYIIYGAGFVAVMIGFWITRKKEQKQKNNNSTVLKGLCAAFLITGLLFHHTAVLADVCNGIVAHSQHQKVCCTVPAMVAVESISFDTSEILYASVVEVESVHVSVALEILQNKSPPKGALQYI